MNHKSPTQSPRSAILAAALLPLLALTPLQAGIVRVTGVPPAATAPDEVLHSQLEGATSGKIISFKKLIKDVQLYPADGSSAMLVTFTIAGTGSYTLKSMTLQIDPVNTVALNDNAVIEMALYRDDDPADGDFMAGEVVASGERFDVAGLAALGGDYFTFVFADGYTIPAGVRYGIALHWTQDSVAPDSILEDKLLFRFARTVDSDPFPGEGYKILNPEAMVNFTFPPDFSGGALSDDPVMVLIGEMAEETMTWGGYPAHAPGSTWVDTGAWLGWIKVEGDWIYLQTLAGWAYFPEPAAGSGGGWGYLLR